MTRSPHPLTRGNTRKPAINILVSAISQSLWIEQRFGIIAAKVIILGCARAAMSFVSSRWNRPLKFLSSYGPIRMPGMKELFSRFSFTTCSCRCWRQSWHPTSCGIGLGHKGIFIRYFIIRSEHARDAMILSVRSDLHGRLLFLSKKSTLRLAE